MLRVVTASTRLARKTPVFRAFSDMSIPTDAEQQWGRRKNELDAAAAGTVAYNRDPVIPAADAGTKENPILVPSGFDSRVVGIEDPFTHQVVWFNLNKGPLHYLPEVGLHFKLVSV